MTSDMDAAVELAARWTLADVREFIASAPWTFARTMPQSPHWYTTRGRTPSAQFEAFVMFIRARGYRARFAGAWYTYFDIDGWTYWTMGAPLGDTVIINRRSADP